MSEEHRDTIILKSRNMLYFRKEVQQSQWVDGFIVYKSLVNNMVMNENISPDEWVTKSRIFYSE